MKNFRVTINGNTYDVAVEEAGESAGTVTAAIPAAAPIAAPAAIPAAQPAAAAPAAATASANATKITSPMPGTVLDIKVSVGDEVRANQVVLILEAMKMENEIVTPVAGKISGIHITKGTSTESGQLLVSVDM